MATVLIVDDHAPALNRLTESLSNKGYQVYGASNLEETRRVLGKASVDIALVDLMFDARPIGLDILSALKSHNPDTLVVMLTAYATIPTAVEAMRRGAYTYLEKNLRDLTGVHEAIDDGLRWQHFSQLNCPRHTPIASDSSVWLNSPINRDLFIHRFRQSVCQVEQARVRDDNNHKKTSLEDLATCLVEAVAGLYVRGRDVRTAAEEIDILVRNESPDLFWRDKVGNPFIIECKNWQAAVGVQQIRSFHGVLVEKGIKTGFLLSVRGVTGDAHRDAMSLLRNYVRDMVHVVVPVDGEHITRVERGEHPTIVLSDAFYDLYRI